MKWYDESDSDDIESENEEDFETKILLIDYFSSTNSTVNTKWWVSVFIPL